MLISIVSQPIKVIVVVNVVLVVDVVVVVGAVLVVVVIIVGPRNLTLKLSQNSVSDYVNILMLLLLLIQKPSFKVLSKLGQ